MPIIEVWYRIQIAVQKTKIMKNREIKFRAWLKDLKTMFNNYAENTLINGGICVVSYHNSSDSAYAKELILMQFTGLKDSKGNDIYEGDILQTKKMIYYSQEELQELPKNHIAEYFDSQTIIKFPDIFYQIASYQYPLKVNECEIIGNIYENPELLENN